MRKIKKVLVLEDDPSIQCMMKEMLEILNCDVTTAAIGEQAIVCSNQQVFDYYFIDINMPDMDGFEAIEKMMLYSHMNKVIIVSANLSPENLDKAKALGIQRFLAKPIKMYDLEMLFKEQDSKL